MDHFSLKSLLNLLQCCFCFMFWVCWPWGMWNFSFVCVCVGSVAKSCLTLWDPVDCSPPGSSCPWNFPGKNTGLGCHVLLQEIYLPDSGVKPTSPALAGRSLPLSHQGSLNPTILAPWSQASQPPDCKEQMSDVQDRTDRPARQMDR